MTAPTVEAANHAWNLVYDLLDERGLPHTRPVDAIAFHHDLLAADDPKGFFTLT